jgi:hypothetical protein
VFDFRYHALSLAAVLVALVIGVLLGVAIGDQQVVSSANERLRNALQQDVREERAAAEELRQQLARTRRFEQSVYPALVRERLDRRRVVLIFAGPRSEGISSSVQEAISPAGGELAFSAQLRDELDLEAIAGAAGGTQYERLAEDPSLADDLGRRVGQQLVQGGRLVRQLREELFATSSGEIDGAEAAVFARAAIDEPGDEPTRAFLDGLLEGLQEFEAPVVGVEETGTDPSQIPFYLERGLASVDNLDEIPGRASLVLALAGSADGAYGVKRTADALLPDALTQQVP